MTTDLKKQLGRQLVFSITYSLLAISTVLPAFADPVAAPPPVPAVLTNVFVNSDKQLVVQFSSGSTAPPIPKVSEIRRNNHQLSIEFDQISLDSSLPADTQLTEAITSQLKGTRSVCLAVLSNTVKFERGLTGPLMVPGYGGSAFDVCLVLDLASDVELSPAVVLDNNSAVVVTLNKRARPDEVDIKPAASGAVNGSDSSRSASDTKPPAQTSSSVVKRVVFSEVTFKNCVFGGGDPMPGKSRIAVCKNQWRYQGKGNYDNELVEVGDPLPLPLQPPMLPHR